MRSIAIINQKGGVGKTTTAVNLSAALARCGQRVGVIDIDPQAHASLHLGIDPQAKVPTVYDVLTEDTRLTEAWQRAGGCRLSAVGSQPNNLPAAESRQPIAKSPAEENLLVAASHIDLAAAEVELAGIVGREVILRDKLAECAGDFDYVIIDCPPSLGILTINALAAVDDVFLPLQPHFLALHGLSKLLKTIGLVNERLNNRLQLAGVVLCLYESGTKLAAEVSHDVEQFFREARQGGRHPQAGTRSAVRLFETRIRRNIRLAEAPSFGQSIFQYAPNSPGAEDYRALGGEVLAYYAGRAILEQSAA
jgi:chromosome partitioning protein